MKKYSIIFVILTSMMAAGLTACGDTARAETIGDTAVSTTAAYKVVISDDYDPTTDENLKEPCRADFDRIEICGKEFTMPCKLEDFDGDLGYEGSPDDCSLTYKGDLIGDRKQYKDSEFSYSYTFFAKSMGLISWMGKSTAVYSVNGFTPDMDYADVFEIFGRPTKTFRSNGRLAVVTYDFDDCRIGFDMYYDKNGDSDGATIYFFYR